MSFQLSAVNTKVDCRFVVQNAAWFTDEEKKKIELRHRNRINTQGELVVVSQASRSQHENVINCILKVQEIIDSLARNYRTRKSKRLAENNASRDGDAHQRKMSNLGTKNAKPVRTKKGKQRMWVWG